MPAISCLDGLTALWNFAQGREGKGPRVHSGRACGGRWTRTLGPAVTKCAFRCHTGFCALTARGCRDVLVVDDEVVEHPDHRAEAGFQDHRRLSSRHSSAIGAVCSQFVALCRRLALLTHAVIAIDDGKFKAVNNRDKNYTVTKVKKRMEQVDASIARYLAALGRADREEGDIAEAKANRL
jgi:hypothetical protein